MCILLVNIRLIGRDKLSFCCARQAEARHLEIASRIGFHVMKNQVFWRNEMKRKTILAVVVSVLCCAPILVLGQEAPHMDVDAMTAAMAKAALSPPTVSPTG